MNDPLPRVRLLDVDSTNWRDVAAVNSRPGQEQFVATVEHYLCLAHYGDDWNPLAIESEGEIVGHVMWAVDEEDDSVWLGGLVIDAESQGKGIGRATVMAFLERFTNEGRTNIALSYSPENLIARGLYLDIGFVETGEMGDDEVVARYQRNSLSP